MFRYAPSEVISPLMQCVIVNRSVWKRWLNISHRPHTERSVKVYDFRSDTVTAPTTAMLRYAEQHASMGDDVFGEDSSTKQLESMLAEMTGHEAALFCVSGTMTNQLALRCWLRGSLQSVLLDVRSHIYKYENAGIAYHSQAGTTPIAPESCQLHLTLDRIKRNRLYPDIHVADTRVIALENTLNGMIFPLEEIKNISEYARSESIIMHLDGARLWNAAAETETDLRHLCQPFDTVSLCLSKGIGAPIGSILVGPKSIVDLARHYRKLMGGGWRQSGLMASMAQYAIEQIFLKRDSEGKSLMQRDHENAKWLSHQLVSRWPGLRIVNPVHTNMLFCDVREMFISLDQTASESDWLSVEELVATVNQLIFERTNGSVVRLPAWGYTFDRGDGRGNVDDTYVMRLVLHYQIDREGCRLLLDYLEQAGNLIKKKKNK